MRVDPDNSPLRYRELVSAWWPLALSWLLMSVEQPAIGAVVARMPDPTLNLDGHGLIFPLALVIEAPIIMLLTASTELSRDRASYRALRSFTHRTGAILTAVHLVIAATPIYGILVERVLGLDHSIGEHARAAFLVMLPWTWAIAWRRFNQGVLIRFGHAKVVGVGTAVRLGAGACVLVTGIVSQLVPGVMVAAAALSAGVLAEGLFIAWQERRLVRPIVEGLHTGEPPLRAGAFWAFYIPLALTPIVALVIQPIGTAAIGRMPEVEESLAVWLLVNGVVFVLQSFGLAYSEVVVALLNRPHAKPRLFAFMVAMAGATTCVLALLAFTPLGHIWFADVCGLEGRLLEMSTQSLWIALPIPACRAALSWYQGLLVNVRRTRPVTEAVVVFAIGCVAVLVAGVSLGRWPGLEVALAGFAVGRSLQTVWLAVRTRHLA